MLGGCCFNMMQVQWSSYCLGVDYFFLFLPTGLFKKMGIRRWKVE